MTDFSSAYPNIAAWTASYGWIEIGENENSKSFIRALDIGGMLWESKPNHKSFDDALNDLEAAPEKIIDEIGYNKRPPRAPSASIFSRTSIFTVCFAKIGKNKELHKPLPA